MEHNFITPPRILIRYLMIIYLFVGLAMVAQEGDKLGCGTVPIEDAYLRDPFYGNSKALLDILREAGYDMPEDYLDNLDTYGNYIGRIKDYGNKASAPVLREIPIKAWVWRNYDGSGNISLSQVNQVINGLNQLFSNNTNIRFYLLCEISEMNNSDIANDGDQYFDQMCLYYKESGVINVHFIIDSNSDWGGKAHFPNDSTVGLRYTCAIEQHSVSEMGAILAHEIGHTLGLYHTHSAGRSWSHSNNGGCGDCHQESVSRTRRQNLGCIGTNNELKCDVNGDFLCDTAADPELSSPLVQYQACNYTSSYTDNWGEIWTPNTSNIMSYSNLDCLEYFSPLQVGKMNYYFTQIGISYPFYSINGSNYVCNGQTVSFSVSSLPGVSSYTWETSSNLPITSGQGTNSITVQATDNYGGYVKVSPGCGYNSRSRYIREFYDLEIDGYDTACAQSGFDYYYTIPPLYGASYTWSITNGTINYGQGTTAVNISLTPNSSNQTWLSLNIDGVCASTVYIHKIITHGDPPPPAEQCFAQQERPLGYQNQEDSSFEDKIKLFPNPTDSNVTVFWPSNKSYTLVVKNVHGTILIEENNITGNRFDINLENYLAGIYFVYLKTDDNTTIKKLIIK